MTTRYDLSILSLCALRVAQRFRARSVAAGGLCDWVEKTDLGFDWAPDCDRYRQRGLPVPLWSELQQKLVAAQAQTRRARPDALARNCAALAEYMGLDAAEAEIFALTVRVAKGGPLQELCDSLVDDVRMSIEDATACLTGLPQIRVRVALRRTGRLIETGLLTRESQNTYHGFALEPSKRLVRALEPPTRGLNDALSRLFCDPGAPEVGWEDFEHLGADRDFAERLLAGAMRRKQRGINLLFYGEPGTGKTEFCKVLAARLGARLHAVGEEDADGDELSRSERQQQLRLGQRLLATGPNALVLFDEMEDLLPAGPALFAGMAHGGGGSKVHLHRLLEQNVVPTLWTTNNIADFDPAMLRRMTLALELRSPPQDIRARVWTRLAARYRMPLDAGTCTRLAQALEVPPALAASAMRAAKVSGGGLDDLQLAVRAAAKAMRGGQELPPQPVLEAPFALELACADADLAHVTARLSAPGASRAISLCLSGVSGTGKSAYARHLAQAMGMPVLQKRASDLLAPFVGQTEQRIAAAFAEARDAGAFLIFDEADSLLANREGAQRSWEVSQVNEMLTWMESHPMPFACTTNLAERLDPATQRRFTFRIRFDWLAPSQLVLAWTAHFGSPPPGGLHMLDRLAPGDFATVSRRMRALGQDDPAIILAELAREADAKEPKVRPIGFGR